MAKDRTYDLNKPDDARDWLTILESDGNVVFDSDDTSQELTDDEAVEVALMVFMTFNEPDSKTVQ